MSRSEGSGQSDHADPPTHKHPVPARFGRRPRSRRNVVRNPGVLGSSPRFGLTCRPLSCSFIVVIDDGAWAGVAARQAGAVSRPQLLEAGLTDPAIHRRTKNGRLRVVLPGVYVVPGSPDTVAQRRWVAHLAVGPASVLSFETAARIKRLSTVAPVGPTVLTVPHSGWQRLAGIRVHQISDLAAVDLDSYRGIPVTSVPRTIVDLAAIWRRGRMGIVVDDADAAKVTSYTEIGTCLRSVARRGKPGVRLLATLLDERGPGHVPPASELEREFFAMVDRFGLPRPARQYPLPRNDGVTGLVDSAWIDRKVIVEVDGRRWHQRIANMKKDRDRDLKASGAGWLVVRPLHEHIVGAPEETARELTDILETRARQLGLVGRDGELDR